MEGLRFEIQGSWDGGPLQANEFARAEVTIDGPTRQLIVTVEATDYADPAPSAPAASLPGLWEYEVVELFLLGAQSRYLEIELGPHGHYLALTFCGPRQLVDEGFPIDFSVERDRGSRARPLWRGRAAIPLERVPRGLWAANFFAIHGRGASRRYLAAAPTGGVEPDFHRLESFPRIDSRRGLALP